MKVDSFIHSSDFVFKAIPFMYPKGYCVVINCFMYSWNGSDQEWKEWLSNKTNLLPLMHPLTKELIMLEVGNCIIFHSYEENEATDVYNIFTDPDHYYVTFWENGEITNENT